jgi:hypothetical protein
MKSAELLKTLDQQDLENQMWLFNTAMFRVLFPNETDNSLKMSLRRHVQAGILRQVKKGLYANERARSAPGDRLTALVSYLKPNDINYFSQETRLSQLGLISQMPLDYVTVMTTGNSQVFKTCYGAVEFTHTKQPIALILTHTMVDEETGLLIADEYLALRDLKNARRNLDLLVTS